MIYDHKQKQILDSGTVVRIYSPAGTYWNQSFSNASAYYQASKDLVLTACHFDRNDHKGDYYSEFDEPTVEEVSLIASLMLALDWDDGAFLMYPLLASVGFSEKLDLTDEYHQKALINDISSCVNFDNLPPWSQSLAPPAYGGRDYCFYDKPLPKETVERIYTAIDTKNYVLLRGLSAFIKAGMIIHHQEIYDAAQYAAYVALDASHQVLLEKLRCKGISNPNTKDAAKSVADAFGYEHQGETYFEEFYEDRIRLMHPKNRFGNYPYVTLSHCDYYQLHHRLREVFKWLILNESASKYD